MTESGVSPDDVKVKTSSSEVDEQFFSMVWLSIWCNLLIEIFVRCLWLFLELVPKYML